MTIKVQSLLNKSSKRRYLKNMFSTTSQLGLISICVLFDKFVTPAEEVCVQGVNCHLPDCFCSTSEHPMGRDKIPQMVYFGFDDGVNRLVIQHYDFLFGRNRSNPNGCPISASLYISHGSTDYNIVKMYYERGFELGVHSVTHTAINTYEKVLKEARDQRENIANLSSVPIEDIHGWRSPNLITAGDGQVKALQSLRYTYDMSLSYPKLRIDDKDMWPFTLDYGCQFSSKCPKQKHRGFWEIPVNQVIWKGKHPCVYTDGCHERPNNTEEAYNFIMDNFYRNYHGNRAPLGIHMHLAWFLHPYTRAGMDMAIEKMLTYGDVYIITAKQVLDWMRHPTNISMSKQFEYWDCDEHIFKLSELDNSLRLPLIVSLGLVLTCASIAITYLIVAKRRNNYTNLKNTLTVDEYID